MGNSDMLVIWFTDTVPGVPKASQSMEAIGVMDEWMTQHPSESKEERSQNRPARAVDSCFDVNGQLIYAGDDAWNGILDDKPAGVCTQRFPLYSTSRIVAGAPIEGGIYKCALKSVERGGCRWRLTAMVADDRRRSSSSNRSSQRACATTAGRTALELGENGDSPGQSPFPALQRKGLSRLIKVIPA